MQGNCSNVQDCSKNETRKLQNTRNRRKTKWKLKFHHQALPPEYLTHYEASLHNQRSSDVSPGTSTSAQSISNNGITFNNGNNTLPVVQPLVQPPRVPTSSLSELQPWSSVQSTVRYTDLPYMGEMTLDNARPRRGRKPKKADICHLIYKNYGTTVIDEPLNLCLRDIKKQNTNNQASLCKFKFTGGAVPCLEEKKFLSIDSINNLKFVNNRSHSNNNNSNKEIRKKNRKSLAREKLEKTFKERGFLIQTQQLESAQGATYCKFRQLKKFTRYLFRSWKNHLPGDIVNNDNA